jgi:CubicO group peptidase (beta-lactamase class C family)
MTRAAMLIAVILSLLSAPIMASASGLPIAKPEEVGLSSARLERITRTLREDVERGRIPGAVVLIARKGRVAYLEAIGFRDKAAAVPMRTDDIFRLASMTKPMASVATMILYEEGKLFLSDPVSKYMKSFVLQAIEE